MIYSCQLCGKGNWTYDEVPAWLVEVGEVTGAGSAMPVHRECLEDYYEKTNSNRNLR